MTALHAFALLHVSIAAVAAEEEVLRFVSGHGFELASGWSVSKNADLKLERDSLVSDTGKVALTNVRELGEVASAPASGYADRVKVVDAESRVAVLQLKDGKYAKFLVVKKEVDEGNDYAPFYAVTIRYAMFKPRAGSASVGKPESADSTRSAVDARLLGAWNMRIPTGVAYNPVRSDGTQTMSIIPGAEFGRITIRKDGSYFWEGLAGKVRSVKGKLVPHKPWFSGEGERFYKISDGKITYLLGWIPSNKKPVTLIHLEGGAVASGEKAKPKK